MHRNKSSKWIFLYLHYENGSFSCFTNKITATEKYLISCPLSVDLFETYFPPFLEFLNAWCTHNQRVCKICTTKNTLIGVKPEVTRETEQNMLQEAKQTGRASAAE